MGEVPRLLRLLNSTCSLAYLKSIHAVIITEGSFHCSSFVLNRLLRCYSRFQATDIAQKLFDQIPRPNSFLWTALIHAYVENFQYPKSLRTFRRMLKAGADPLSFTIASIIKVLAREERGSDGEAVYGLAMKFGMESDIIVQNTSIDFFMRWGKTESARKVFDGMIERDIISWNSMVMGYGNNGRIDLARQFFDETPVKDAASWTCMICSYIKDSNMAQASALFEQMPEKDLPARNVILSAYMDSGDIANATRVFNDVITADSVSWNIMISGFCKAGDLKSAEEYFERMPRRGVASWTMMVDGYMKSGNFERARSLFDQMPKKNLISWSTMIEGYVRNGQPRLALELYELFKTKGIDPDETFVLGVISACSQLGIVSTAESIVSEVFGRSASSNLKILTSMIDLYAKSGRIEKALETFRLANKKDLHCYSAMITALGNHGLSADAIMLFEDMQNKNIKPDGVAFLGVLTACNHGGLVDRGRQYFDQMRNVYGIRPSEKHYACVVDLLGRAGFLEEVHKLINEMTVIPHAVVWGALLAACRIHCNVDLAEIAAAMLFKIEPENSGNYILLSNIYSAVGRWNCVANTRIIIRENQILKSKGSSWIEMENLVHEFAIGDNSHTDTEAIYIMLNLLSEDSKLLAYVPDSEMLENASLVHSLRPLGSCSHNLLNSR